MLIQYTHLISLRIPNLKYGSENMVAQHFILHHHVSFTCNWHFYGHVPFPDTPNIGMSWPNQILTVSYILAYGNPEKDRNT